MTRCLLLVLILACLLAACAPCGSIDAPLLCMRHQTTILFLRSAENKLRHIASLPVPDGDTCAALGPAGCASRLEVRR